MFPRRTQNTPANPGATDPNADMKRMLQTLLDWASQDPDAQREVAAERRWRHEMREALNAEGRAIRKTATQLALQMDRPSLSAQLNALAMVAGVSIATATTDRTDAQGALEAFQLAVSVQLDAQLASRAKA